ncbi:hypothetical protein LSS_07324 [Leptospira santarosai serovar Shermani str. LT 821]|uniref:Uncharacterized protein n=1 Tax=Leptospira santarosai serovar Shermani str. LT 821 TaxID=758847 RepID=K8Y198_9LEPT|nr:hypothetical protein LSS_07324 [Leptospira santarosai serovar Shermani str. LT 821]
MQKKFLSEVFRIPQTGRKKGEFVFAIAFILC